MFMDSLCLWVVVLGLFFLLLPHDKFSPMKFKCKIIFAKYGQNTFSDLKKNEIFYQLLQQFKMHKVPRTADSVLCTRTSAYRRMGLVKWVYRGTFRA